MASFQADGPMSLLTGDAPGQRRLGYRKVTFSFAGRRRSTGTAGAAENPIFPTIVVHPGPSKITYRRRRPGRADFSFDLR